MNNLNIHLMDFIIIFSGAHYDLFVQYLAPVPAYKCIYNQQEEV